MFFTAPFRSLFHRGLVAGQLGATSAPVALAQMPDSETNFWHRQYRFEPYFVAGRSFDQYCPAYQLGWQLAQSPEGSCVDFDAMDRELNLRWTAINGSSLLNWSQVRLAAKAAWERGMRPQSPDVLSVAAGKKLVRTQEAARQFRQSSVSYLAGGAQGMHAEALKRFAAVSAKLLSELEALPVEVEPLPLVSGKAVPYMLERSRQVWRDSGLMAADSIQDVLAKLQTWLGAVESLCQEMLPAHARKLLSHHMLVLRGQLEAVQWLSRGQA